MRDLQPLERDGVAEFTVGTAAFALASVVLWFGRDALGIPWWWVQVALTGLVIGLIGTGYCLWRRRDRRAMTQSNSDLS